MKEGTFCHVKLFYCEPYTGPIMEYTGQPIDVLKLNNVKEMWLPAIFTYQGIESCIVAYMDLNQNIHKFSPVYPNIHTPIHNDDIFNMIDSRYKEMVQNKLLAYYYNDQVPTWLHEKDIFIKETIND